MITWIIISVVLYLLGMMPVHSIVEGEKEESDPSWFAKIVAIFWFLFVTAWIISEAVVYFRSLKNKKVAKCLLPLLFISLAACNDGGSPAPDYVRYDPEEAKYYDSIANSKDSLNLKNDRAKHHN